jgi:hypothetical protein
MPIPKFPNFNGDPKKDIIKHFAASRKWVRMFEYIIQPEFIPTLVLSCVRLNFYASQKPSCSRTTLNKKGFTMFQSISFVFFYLLLSSSHCSTGCSRRHSHRYHLHLLHQYWRHWPYWCRAQRCDCSGQSPCRRDRSNRPICSTIHVCSYTQGEVVVGTKASHHRHKKESNNNSNTIFLLLPFHFPYRRITSNRFRELKFQNYVVSCFSNRHS